MFKRVAVVVVSLAVLMPVEAAQEPQSMFVFQNKFWINLHQFLRGEVFRQRTDRRLGVDPASLSNDDRIAWASALEVYVEVAKGDLVFDENARRIANALATAGDVDRLPEGLLEARVTAALNAAAPIYRARLWPARQRLSLIHI